MRALMGFWVAVLGVTLATAGVLQFLGAPARPGPVARVEPPSAPAAVPGPAMPGPALPATVPAPALPSQAPAPIARAVWDGRIPAPNPALLEASRLVPNALLPRIAPDGRTPMQLYARPFDATDTRPRIGLLVAGLGLAEVESRAAIETLPGAVSLAVSAYGQRLDPLLQAARDRGHELLASIPMESSNYPLADAGNRSLLTSAGAETNQRMLETVLGRIAGYAGTTGASDGMRGERFVQLQATFGRVTDELARRGLFYIDPRPPAPGTTPLRASTLATRAVDVLIDEPLSRADIEAKLVLLERIARDRGAAIGLASSLRPVTLDRLAAWARTVEMRGFVLAPVSALVPPAPPEAGAAR